MDYSRGEWKVDRHEVVSNAFRCGSGYYIVARVITHLEEETLANANLISAAPDMYKALKLTLDETPNRPLGEDIKLNIRKALAKAEGCQEDSQQW